MAKKRLFIPFGKLLPDAREFNNVGVIQALNVTPMGDTYVPSRTWETRTAPLPGTPPKGLLVHPSTVSQRWYGYFGTVTTLYEATSTDTEIWSINDKSRVSGGVYTADLWHGASFGDAAVLTNGVDDPQLLISPAATNFVKLAQSGSGNPGMDPKAKYAFPVRGNMFLAYLNLAAGFDGLLSGANPTTLCWSQTDNVRQYGSFNVTPQLTGCGYQPLNYDFGAITGGTGGQYALVAMQRGWVRGDGPPYTFRPISEGIGCQCSKSIVRFDDDVYFWGPNGPMVFRGGAGPAIAIAKDKLSRTLVDQLFGGDYSASVYSGADPLYVSAGCDHVSRQVWWAFSGPNVDGETILMHDVDSGQFSFQTPRKDGAPDTVCGILFLQTRPEQFTGWTPGRDLVGILGDGTNYYLATPIQSSAPVACILEKGYMELDADMTTRVVRVRPVYSMRDATTTPTVSVSISSKNNPFDIATPKTFSGALDTHGWLSTPDTVFADFHRLKLAINAVPGRITEISGLEVEYLTGGVYSA